MPKKPAPPKLELVTPLARFTFDPLLEEWLGSVALSPRESVEVTLPDGPHEVLVANLAGLGKALGNLRAQLAPIKGAVAAKIHRADGVAWKIPSAKALERALRVRSVRAKEDGSASVFFDRLPMLGGHAIAFALSRAARTSDVHITG